MGYNKDKIKVKCIDMQTYFSSLKLNEIKNDEVSKKRKRQKIN